MGEDDLHGRGIVNGSDDAQADRGPGVTGLGGTESGDRYDADPTKPMYAPRAMKPVQKPHPPLRFGGHHPKVLKRTVELADGFLGAGSLLTTKFGEEVTLLGRLLQKARAGKRLTKTERAAHRIEEIPPWYRCASGIRVGRAIPRRGLMLKCKT